MHVIFTNKITIIRWLNKFFWISALSAIIVFRLFHSFSSYLSCIRFSTLWLLIFLFFLFFFTLVMIAYDWKLEKIPLTNRFKRWYCFWCKRNAHLLYWLTECLFSQQNASKNEKEIKFSSEKSKWKLLKLAKSLLSSTSCRCYRHWSQIVFSSFIFLTFYLTNCWWK